jgi:hypothetical protein
METITKYSIKLEHDGKIYTVENSVSIDSSEVDLLMLRFLNSDKWWAFEGIKQTTVVGETKTYYLSRHIINKSVVYKSKETKSIN